MEITHLQSVEKFRDIMTINADVDSKTIQTALYNTQLVELRQILGTSLYTKIVELISTLDIQLVGNVAYKGLLDEYILPSLRSHGMARLIPHLTSQLTDKGLQSRSGEFSQQASASAAKAMRQRYENDAEYLDGLLLQYLCDNTTLFPEYNDGATSSQNGKTDNYFSGIEFG